MSYSTRLNGYQAFKFNMAIRQHFETDNYDIWLKKGKIRFPRDKFDARNDAKIYHRLAYDYLRGDLGNFLMANVLAGKTHISEYEDIIFRDWKSKMHRIEYIFESELKKMDGLGVEFRDLFDSASGGLPIIIQLMQGNHISLETVCIINLLTKGAVMDKWERKINDKFVWPSIHRKIIKYQTWLRVDLEPLKPMLKEYL